DRLAGLDRQRLLVAQSLEVGDDVVERGAAARRPGRPAAELEGGGAVRGFGLQAACAQDAPARRADRAREFVNQSSALRPGYSRPGPRGSSRLHALSRVALASPCQGYAQCATLVSQSNLGNLDGGSYGSTDVSTVHDGRGDLEHGHERP